LSTFAFKFDLRRFTLAADKLFLMKADHVPGRALRSFAPSSSRGLAKGDFHPFGSTLVFFYNAVTRVVTCFARVITSFAGIPEKTFQHVFRFGVFSQ
jgi:hypothetical protein